MLLAACSGANPDDAGKAAAGTDGHGAASNGAASNGAAGNSQAGMTAAGVGGSMQGAGGTASAGTGGSGGAPAATTEAEACFAYVRGFCALRMRCMYEDLELTAAQLRSAERGCFVESASECPDLIFSDGSPRTIEGTLACAQDWRDLSCEDYAKGMIPDCSLAGTRAAGAACVFNFQCASRACHTEANMCGTCNRVVGLAENCNDGNSVCDAGLICDGEACREKPPPDPPPAKPVIPMLGEACDPTGIACGGLGVARCAHDVANDRYSCVAWPTLGADCAESRGCLLNDSYCDHETSRCVALPSDGQRCGVDLALDEPTWCATGSRCDVMPEVCDVLPSGMLSCHTDPAFCRAYPSGGQDCTAAHGCQLDLMCLCDDEMCMTRSCRNEREPGETCSGPFDRCLQSATRCEGGTCVAVGSQQLFETRCTP